MEIFKSIKTIHEDSTSKIIIGKLSNMKNKYKFVNWSKNRPCDSTRIDSITRFYDKNQVDVVPGVVSCNQIGNDMHVYDGSHRLHAAMKRESDMHVMISVKKNWTEDQIKSDFKNINQGVNVPYIYMEESSHVKKAVCEEVVAKLCKQFPTNRSASRFCQKQNFNRDNVIEFVSKLEIDFEESGIAVKIYEIFLQLNGIGKKFVEDGKMNVPKKVVTTGLYMFYLTDDYRKNHIEEYLNIGI